MSHILATPYHPLTNGQVERYNATMDAKIAALCNDRRTNWDEQLPFVAFNYNTSIHSTSGIVPFNIVYGRSCLLPFDLHDDTLYVPSAGKHLNELSKYLSTITAEARQNILNQQMKHKSRYDSNRSNPLCQVGDLALIKNIVVRHKFDIRYDEPHRII